MQKVDWKGFTIFVLVLIILCPVIYHLGLWVFSYDLGPPAKAESFGPILRYRVGETLPAGNAVICPLIPTSLCQGNFYLVPVSSAKRPTQL